MKTHIIIHHSATEDGRTFDWTAIRRYHMSHRVDGDEVTKAEFERRQAAGEGHTFELPWRDIGYHWGIENVSGSLEVVQGRPMAEDGAHVRDFNKNTIGICCVGNFDEAEPGEKLLAKLQALVTWLRTLYGIPKDNVIGHHEAQAILGIPAEDRKTCPGILFDMDKFRALL